MLADLTDAQLVSILKKAMEQHEGDIPLTFLLMTVAERLEALSRLADEWVA